MTDTLQNALQQLRLSLQGDGADVITVEHTENSLKLRIEGESAGCELLHLNLEKEITRYLHKGFPEINTIEFV